jgi:hypothetical protein
MSDNPDVMFACSQSAHNDNVILYRGQSHFMLYFNKLLITISFEQCYMLREKSTRKVRNVLYLF